MIFWHCLIFPDDSSYVFQGRNNSITPSEYYIQENYIFGYDWLGNCFGISKDEKNSDKVILLEIGTGEILSTECYFEDFINNEIPYNADACLASQFYETWLNNGGTTAKYGRCIGYKVPLFMGGQDDITNLEESDMDVYWGILSQLIIKLRVNR